MHKELIKNGEYEYTREDNDLHRIHRLYASNKETWANHFKGSLLCEIIEDLENEHLLLPKQNMIDYGDAEHLRILLKKALY